MMLEAVETRFETLRAPHKATWRLDKISPHTARNTRLFTAQLDLVPCLISVARSELNGFGEAFPKTLKWGFVRLKPLRGAASALQQTAEVSA